MNDIFFIVVFQAVGRSFFLIFDVSYFLTRIRRCFLQMDPADSQLLQKDANKLYEGPTFEIADHYANLISTFWSTLFFVSIFPLANAFTVLGLFLLYWASKYLLLNRYSRPIAMNSKIALDCFPLIRVGPFVLAVRA